MEILKAENKKKTILAYHNIEVRSRNHCSSGKAVSIEYSECVLLL